MLPETIAELAKVPQITAVKEATGDMDRARQLIDLVGDKLAVYSGDDATALPTVLAGGAGVISVLGQGVPSLFSDMIKFGLEGNAKDAYAIHHKLSALMTLIFEEGNPAGIKSIFECKGISRATVRLPLVEASQSLKEKISSSLKSLDKAHV